MIRRLGHACYGTDRFEDMTRFYRDGLGLAVKFPFVGRDGATFGVYLAAGEMTFLEIFDRAGSSRAWGRGEPPPPFAAGEGHVRHLCFEVENLDAYVAALAGRGITATPTKTGMDGSRQAWVTDPDGNRVELMEYTPRSLQLTGGTARIPEKS